LPFDKVNNEAEGEASKFFAAMFKQQAPRLDRAVRSSARVSGSSRGRTAAGTVGAAGMRDHRHRGSPVGSRAVRHRRPRFTKSGTLPSRCSTPSQASSAEALRIGYGAATDWREPGTEHGGSRAFAMGSKTS
jgi:hypothetical protein